jgi:hypothetical protein
LIVFSRVATAKTLWSCPQTKNVSFGHFLAMESIAGFGWKGNQQPSYDPNLPSFTKEEPSQSKLLLLFG